MGIGALRIPGGEGFCDGEKAEQHSGSEEREIGDTPADHEFSSIGAPSSACGLKSRGVVSAQGQSESVPPVQVALHLFMVGAPVPHLVMPHTHRMPADGFSDLMTMKPHLELLLNRVGV